MKRGNESKPTSKPHKNPKTSFNTHLRQVHSRTKSFGKVMETVIQNQWDSNFRPEWFITIRWNDLPTSYDTVEKHTRHLRNVLMTQLMRCGSPRDLPDPPGRPSAVFFHERSEEICRGRLILPFHTHLHLGKFPPPQDDYAFVYLLMHDKVAPRVKKLLKTTTLHNKGLVIKRFLQITGDRSWKKIAEGRPGGSGRSLGDPHLMSWVRRTFLRCLVCFSTVS